MFERISVAVKTFLRDEKLFRACDSILKALPGAHIIVADDGEMNDTKAIYYEGLESLGHTVIQLPFDSGFGKKSGAIINALATPYLLIFSDDFDVSAPDCVVGVEKLLSVLDSRPELSIVSGRLRSRGPYEFHLVERQPGEWYERPCAGSEYFNSIVPCDVTVNYSLIRRNVFWTEGLDTNENGTGWVEKRTSIGFDDEEIIGEGGHGAFFLDCKKAGIKVAYVPGVFIDEMPEADSERYRQYRRRACGPSRKCFEKRQLKRYVLGSGVVDYERKEQ